MEVTNISIKESDESVKNPIIKAFAEIVLNNVFVIHSIKIVEQSGKYSITMPALKNKNGSVVEICYFTDKKLKTEVKNLILEKYFKSLAEKN